MYGRSLEHAVRADFASHLERLMLALLQANRDESDHVDQERAVTDAQRFYEAGEGMMGTDEDTFNTILVAQNPAQLRVLMMEYQKLSGRSLIDAIKRETSVNYRATLMAIVLSTLDRTAYLAERIWNTMEGFGTRENDLIRLIVSRSEIDLANIKQEYHRLHRRSMESSIAADTSRYFEKALLMIVKGN
ncbi:annexin A7-like [Pollicipes pollicipes]|uniref:annexin A7-like n=1 Tax=Pollicipes pollicipes TaxID=41117 RepID=UPI0018858F35|nr:annexin A7-like [Pollicipes pollicipes]